MKEIKLEINKAGSLKNQYNVSIKIGRTTKGYFIVTENNKYGPFEKVFIEKEDDVILIGSNQNESKLYRLCEDGLILEKKETIDLFSKKQEFESCRLLGQVNAYSIFFDDTNGKFFAVNNLTSIKQLSEYPKFDSYESLLNYYATNNISLNDKDIRSLVNKMKKIFIKIEDLIEISNNLSIDKIDEDILFDIVANRSILKKLYLSNRFRLLKIVMSEKIANDLLDNGYIEIKNTSFENLMKVFPEDMKKYTDIVESKISKLQSDTIEYIKRKDSFSFEEIVANINKISIVDLPVKIQAEISANRPLTNQIFSGILMFALDNTSNIRNEYKVITNFKAVYPEQYDKLWEIAKLRLPDLYKEYYDERAKKIAKLLKSSS